MILELASRLSNLLASEAGLRMSFGGVRELIEDGQFRNQNAEHWTQNGGIFCLAGRS